MLIGKIFDEYKYIGRAIVVGAAKEGGRVAIFDLDLSQAIHVATTIRSYLPYVQVLPVRADVTDESMLEGEEGIHTRS